VTNLSPRITDDFKSLENVSWYGSVYLLTATAFQPSFGKIYQIFNVKGTYISVMSIFMLGSLISAVSENSAVFIIGRAIAGLGVSGAFSGGLTIIAYTVPLEKRASFTGALGALFGVFSLSTFH
jgi:MFS family permease